MFQSDQILKLLAYSLLSVSKKYTVSINVISFDFFSRITVTVFFFYKINSK